MSVIVWVPLLMAVAAGVVYLVAPAPSGDIVKVVKYAPRHSIQYGR